MGPMAVSAAPVEPKVMMASIEMVCERMLLVEGLGYTARRWTLGVDVLKNRC